MIVIRLFLSTWSESLLLDAPSRLFVRFTAVYDMSCVQRFFSVVVCVDASIELFVVGCAYCVGADVFCRDGGCRV